MPPKGKPINKPQVSERTRKAITQLPFKSVICDAIAKKKAELLLARKAEFF